MAGAVGIAIRGAGKALLKGKVKPRGTPTKAGLVARRAALRGETTAEKYRKALGPIPKGVKSDKERETVGIVGTIGAAGAVGYSIGKSKAKKEDKAKETKEKLTKSVEEHKKKTKKQKEKQKK
jgi:hypothetical protein